MPSTRKGFGVRLTVAEDDLIDREAVRTEAPSLSHVFEKALADFMREHMESGRTNLLVPTTGGLRNHQLVARQFRLQDDTMAMIDEMIARHGWSRQILARAAMLRLTEEAAARERAEAGAAAGDEPGGGA